MKTINIGKENATFQEICALKDNRTKRIHEGKFFVEGVQNIKDALSSNWEIYAFIYSDYDSLSDWAKGILGKAEYCYNLSDNLMQKLSDKDEVSEILAIIKIKKQNIDIKSSNPIILLLDRPSKKGNFGSIIRSADAMNVDQILFTGHAVDIYDHNVITASMGSFFKVPFMFVESNSEFEKIVQELKNKYKDFVIVGTSLQTENSLDDYDFNRPVMILVGNETNGLNKYYNQVADSLVKIDMRSGIDSLNVACATTTVLYEVNRQRKNAAKYTLNNVAVK